MKICNTQETSRNPILFPGNLYRQRTGTNLYFCGIRNGTYYLFNLKTGNVYATSGGCGNDDKEEWLNVTNQYCLQAVSA